MNITKILLSLIVFFMSMNGFCQDLKRRVKRDNFEKEIFYIDKETKYKNGPYCKIDIKTNDTLCKGELKDDEKICTWTYFSDKNKVYILFNHSTNEVKFVSQDALEVDSFLVSVNDSFIVTNVDRQPLYLGSSGFIKNYIARTLRMPQKMSETGQTGILAATFIVNSQGKVQDIKIVQPLNDELDQQLIDCLNEFKENWIPALRNGTPIDSKIVVVSGFLSDSNIISTLVPNINEPYIWDIVLTVVYFGGY